MVRRILSAMLDSQLGHEPFSKGIFDSDEFINHSKDDCDVYSIFRECCSIQCAKFAHEVDGGKLDVDDIINELDTLVCDGIIMGNNCLNNFFQFISKKNFVLNGTREQNYESLLKSNRKLLEYDMKVICDKNQVINELINKKFLVNKDELYMILNPYIKKRACQPDYQNFLRANKKRKAKELLEANNKILKVEFANKKKSLYNLRNNKQSYK